MTFGMSVVGVRQRPHQRKQMTLPGQQRQMLAYEHSWRTRGNRLELTPDGIRRIRLQVETLMLRQASRQKDVDDALGFDRS